MVTPEIIGEAIVVGGLSLAAICGVNGLLRSRFMWPRRGGNYLHPSNGDISQLIHPDELKRIKADVAAATKAMERRTAERAAIRKDLGFPPNDNPWHTDNYDDAVTAEWDRRHASSQQ